MNSTLVTLGAVLLASVAMLAGLHMVLRYLRDSLLSSTQEATLRREVENAAEASRRRIDAVAEALAVQTEKLTHLSNRRQ